MTFASKNIFVNFLMITVARKTKKKAFYVLTLPPFGGILILPRRTWGNKHTRERYNMINFAKDLWEKDFFKAGKVFFVNEVQEEDLFSIAKMIKKISNAKDENGVDIYNIETSFNKKSNDNHWSARMCVEKKINIKDYRAPSPREKIRFMEFNVFSNEYIEEVYDFLTDFSEYYAPKPRWTNNSQKIDFIENLFESAEIVYFRGKTELNNDRLYHHRTVTDGMYEAYLVSLGKTQNWLHYHAEESQENKKLIKKIEEFYKKQHAKIKLFLHEADDDD